MNRPSVRDCDRIVALDTITGITMTKTRIGIINVTGYAGAELARLLMRHPDVELAQVTGRSAAGNMLADVFPHLATPEIRIDPALDASVDFVFSALPHAASAAALGEFIDAGIPCVDISADFRIKDLATYEQWYKVEHPCPQHIESAVYGLPEIYGDEIGKTKLVANPGCYPTGAILGLAPALRKGMIEPDIIVDAKSGVSGAGRSADVRFNFSELNDNMSAYALGGHRHAPEMTQELNALSESVDNVTVTFVPHLAPMTRGILGTCYAKLKDGTNAQHVAAAYRDYYAAEPFVHVVDTPPATKQTWGSNDVRIHATVDKAANRLIVVSALDNLVKGAAGAAVQNMNLMQGMPETTGLEQQAVYP